MQELEKILKEIKGLHGEVGSECTIEDRHAKRAWEHCLKRVEDIVCNHMNDGWIPVEKRLPEESAYYLVTIEDYGMPYSWIKWLASSDDYNIEKSEWRELDDGEKVIAWQPLPEPYRPEKST